VGRRVRRGVVGDVLIIASSHLGGLTRASTVSGKVACLGSEKWSGIGGTGGGRVMVPTDDVEE